MTRIRRPTRFLEGRDVAVTRGQQQRTSKNLEEKMVIILVPTCCSKSCSRIRNQHLLFVKLRDAMLYLKVFPGFFLI